jgi:hypothetical protein
MENLLKKAQDLMAAGQLNEDLLQEVNAAMGDISSQLREAQAKDI